MMAEQRKPKILIADDHPQMRAYIQAALESLPVEVLMAADGMDAMALVESVRPDLLLTDYQMQIVDGLTLAHQIRERPDLKPTKIVLITGKATEAEVLQAVNHGLVDAALLKPVDVYELQLISRRLLNLLV